MRFFKLPSLLVVVGLVLGVGPARGQDAAPAPAHIAAVDGAAILNRDGQVDQAIVNMPFVAGDHLRTTAGRVEILFPDGTALDVDQFTEVGLESESTIRLSEGRALLRVPNARYTARRYDLLTPATSIAASSPGEYRLSYPDAYETARADDFDRWVDAQARTQSAPSASAQYLPPDLQVYGPEFDRYGGWQYDGAYGYVWYPTVAPTWRPYYDGYWAPVPTYGWTWIGAGAWSWPTHHYGRWGWHHERWFWIPARSWAPAWVAWGAATDYVSWCPLGWDSRPVFALSFGYRDSWRGWTVLPRGVFGDSRVSVARHVVPPGRLHPDSTPFIVQSRAPIAVPRAIASSGMPASQAARSRGGATTRYGAPSVAPPSTAMPRTGTPFYQPSERAAASADRSRAPNQGTAVPRYAPPAYGNPAPASTAPTVIDRRRTYTPVPSGVTPGSAYRMPAMERRPMTAAPQAATPEPSRVAPSAPPARVAPYVPSRTPSYAPPPPPQATPAPAPRGGALPRQEPIVRQPSAPPSAQPQPTSRPQAQPRAEPAGGGRPQPPPPSRGEAQQGSGQRRPR